MTTRTSKPLASAALAAIAALTAGAAIAGGVPPPPSTVLCHNIGGPRDLGANCDMTGNCSFILDGGSTITVAPNNFLGIIIGASPTALPAHIAHGDGFVLLEFDPPLHLASVIGPHRASNVECLATRVIPQPEEPGN